MLLDLPLPPNFRTVEKEHFLDLAKNFNSLTIEETLAVDELQQAYPYSQVIHCLATRGARDHQLEKSDALMALSAVYATDRVVLKSIMTAPRLERGVEKQVEVPQGRPVDPVTVAPEPVEHVEFVGSGLSGDALNEEIMLDLDRLQKLKRDFEDVFIEYSTGTKTPVRKPVVETKSRQEPPAPPATRKEPPARPALRAKAPDALGTLPPGEAIIEEIAARKRVTPESEKQKEQIKIIDQFISKQPSITRPTHPPGGTPDLTEKGADLIDSMVSETLVEILLRQGKKDKAIEVLRKLIWKFPQKKAIFAAQIDELKK